MTGSGEIQDNLYSLYDDITASGLVSAGTAGGFSFIRHAGFAWPNMAYPGRSTAGSPGSLDLGPLVERIKGDDCPRLVLMEEGKLTADLMDQINDFRFVHAAQWINMALPFSGAEREVGRKHLDCRIVNVREPDEWNDWASVATEVLFKKAKLAKDLFAYGDEKGFFRLLTGYYEDQPVCTSLLYSGKLAGVYMVATLPSFQGKGFGKELMRFTASTATAAGYSGLVLHSTSSGLELYQRLGFQAYGKLLLYYCMI